MSDARQAALAEILLDCTNEDLKTYLSVSAGLLAQRIGAARTMVLLANVSGGLWGYVEDGFDPL